MSDLGDQLTALAAQVAATLDADASAAASQAAVISGLSGQVMVLTQEVADLKAKYEPQPMPLLAGLSAVNMKTPPTPVVQNYICNVYWKDLQAVPYGPLTSGNPIDAALASGKPFRVRLFFGQHSPTWAGADAGTITVTDAQDSVTAAVPNWFDPELQRRQADLLQKLAAAYDGKISAIFMGTNATVYPEPFMRETGDAATRANLLKAPGYSRAADQDTYRLSMDMFSVFKQTRLAWSFNPHQYVNPDGTGGTDSAFTAQIMDEFRTRFPSGIVQNNSIRTPNLKGYAGMYAHMATVPPLSFQTSTLPRVGDLATTIQWAIDQGAHMVEMNAGYGLTDQQMADFDAALRANVK